MTTDATDEPFHTDGNKTDIQCGLCGRMLSSRHALLLHLFLHSANRSYLCGVCGRTYPEIEELKDHLVIHSKDLSISRARESGVQTSVSLSNCHLNVPNQGATSNRRSQRIRWKKPSTKPACSNDSGNQKAFTVSDDNNSTIDWVDSLSHVKSSTDLSQTPVTRQGDVSCQNSKGNSGNQLGPFAQFFSDSDNLKTHTFRYDSDSSTDSGDTLSPAQTSNSRTNSHPHITPHFGSNCPMSEKSSLDKPTIILLPQQPVISTSEKVGSVECEVLAQKCDTCGEICVGANSFRQHMEIHADYRNRHQCGICLKIFRQASFLKSHILLHTGVRPYPCPVCGKTFKRKTHVRLHMRQHTAERLATCEICGKSMKHYNLKIHMKLHSGESVVTCPICDKQCANSYLLKRHVNWHTGFKPFKCSLCDQGFMIKSKLNIHIRVKHTDEKPFTCEICGKSFAEKSYLNLHMLTHTGNYKYSCDECGLKFVTPNRLLVHRRRHTGEKPLQCEICGRNFGSAAVLKKHLLIHSGEKPFQCNVCLKKFRQSGALKTHSLIHTGDKPKECKVCLKKFRHLSSLNTHMRSHEKATE